MIALSEMENEPTVKTVMYALKGACLSGDDYLFATEVQKIVREVMLPKLMNDKLNNIANQN